jgi:nuclease S1
MAFSFRTVVVSLLFAVGVQPFAAHAWGGQGHRLVGALAEKDLNRDARREVARLLRGEPDPTLAGVADWADELRENDPNLGRLSARWHYVNMAEDGCAYRQAQQCPNGDCVIEAIRSQAALLADRRQPDAVRRQALKFLVHFVGDVHQPLHTGYARDRGGNTYQLQVDGQGSNLHRVWDGDIVVSAQRSDRAYLRHLRKLPLPADANENDPARWASVACRVVLEDGFYPPQPQLTPAYLQRWRPTADRQLRLAGHRLAMLLNDVLKPPAR